MKDDRFRIGKVYKSVTDPKDAEGKIERAVSMGEKGYICVSNPRTVTYGTKHEDYRKVMEESLMNLPDAEPMLWAARAWGLKQVERTMGPVLFNKMLMTPESGLKHFLMGDTEETLSKIVEKYQGANIVGTYSPAFCKLEEYDYRQIAQMVNNTHADIIWVSMRAPKQDFFSRNLLPYLDAGICIGVGAAFRFNLGEYKMAPPIIKKLGLMGLYWGKKNQTWFAFLWGYAKDNLPFISYLLRIYWRRLFGKKYNE